MSGTNHRRRASTSPQAFSSLGDRGLLRGQVAARRAFDKAALDLRVKTRPLSAIGRAGPVMRSTTGSGSACDETPALASTPTITRADAKLLAGR